jgi:hypothetical protein
MRLVGQGFGQGEIATPGGNGAKRDVMSERLSHKETRASPGWLAAPQRVLIVPSLRGTGLRKETPQRDAASGMGLHLTMEGPIVDLVNAGSDRR